MKTETQTALPVWSVGSITGTLFKDGAPTGTEFKVFNRSGGSPAELVKQANAAAQMLDALHAVQALAPESATHIHRVVADAIAAASP
jgi:hypothetical protein